MHTKILTYLLVFVLTTGLPLQAIAVTEPAKDTPILWSTLDTDRDFIITAYYSPVPGQCAYIMGDLEADKVLNGQGTNGADGTEVYPGMLAAPKVYAFGTRITLPGIGTVTVNDRGGAILAGENADRLDLWTGKGEEGLARALAFGVKRVRGHIYPVGSEQPLEHIDLTALPAPTKYLYPYLVEGAAPGDCGINLRFGEGVEKQAERYADAHEEFAFRESLFGTPALLASIQSFKEDMDELEFLAPKL